MAKFIIMHSVKVATEFVPQTFGRLTTLGPKFRLPVGNQGRHKSVQVCLCACGETTVVGRIDLHEGRSQSCGCLRRELASQAQTTHGMCGSPEYRTWQNMTQRCCNPSRESYHCYGGRGIRVCDRWLEPNGQGFINFLSDMGERPSKDLSIDRHPNPDGNYEPNNCRWATVLEQSRNRKTNVILSHNGKTQCLKDWAKDIGLREATLRHRIKKLGWSTARAITTPSRKNKSRNKTA